ncbi:hypothetical protein WJX79_008107 [Trebouxia sp. C0005]
MSNWSEHTKLPASTAKVQHFIKIQGIYAACSRAAFFWVDSCLALFGCTCGRLTSSYSSGDGERFKPARQQLVCTAGMCAMCLRLNQVTAGT